MLGVDMLVGTLLKAAGFDREVVEPAIINYVGMLNSQVRNFDSRLTELEINQRQIIKQNSQIIAMLQPKILLTMESTNDTNNDNTSIGIDRDFAGSHTIGPSVISATSERD